MTDTAAPNSTDRDHQPDGEDEPEGADFAPDPAPVRSDQLPEDAPESVASD
ncbi:MAG: hypothetical protein QOH12_2354 [Solirubrobacteraceae bacterium]|jgi:hypothetical protein|nr:hypothetical protein [Solirubrobacteraceae bacterium]